MEAGSSACLLAVERTQVCADGHSRPSSTEAGETGDRIIRHPGRARSLRRPACRPGTDGRQGTGMDVQRLEASRASKLGGRRRRRIRFRRGVSGAIERGDALAGRYPSSAGAGLNGCAAHERQGFGWDSGAPNIKRARKGIRRRRSPRPAQPLRAGPWRRPRCAWRAGWDW